MAYAIDSSKDAALDVIKTGDKILFCSSEPTDYADALSKQIAHKDSPSFGSNGDYAGGRQFTIAAITDAIGDADGTVAAWAIVNSTGTSLLAANTVTPTFAVTNGQTDIPVDAFTIQAPDAVSA